MTEVRYDLLPASAKFRARLRQVASALFYTACISWLANFLLLSHPLYLIQIYDRVLQTRSTDTLFFLTLIVISAVAVLTSLSATKNILLNRTGHWLEEQIAPLVLAACVRARLHADDQSLHSLTQVAKLRHFLSGRGVGTFLDLPWVPLFFLVLWFLHPWLFIVGLFAGFLQLSCGLFTEILTREKFLQSSTFSASCRKYADAAVRNAEVAHATGMIEPLFKRWSVDLARSLDLSNSAEDRIALIVSISQFFRLTAAIAVLGIGAFLVLKQELSPGAILAGSVILARSLAPLEQAMGAWRLFVDARLAKNRLGSLFATADEEHSATAFPFSIPQGAACQIDFSGVSLWFERQEMPVLKNVDVSLHSGKIAALIGPSGGGKSTFCRLLLGIQAPSAGTIRLNGIPAEMLSNSDRSRLFGYLPQQVEFFPGTIKDNIARMEAGASERDVTRAAMLCSVHEMILSLPRGYDTWLDEGAWRLSGGQRQRIGLARAVYGDPMFVILDEPNANLDATGEHALRGAIMTLKQQGAAVLIVDHRHSTLSYADDVFLLEAGLVQMRDPRDIALQRHDGVDRMLVSQ